MRTEEERISAIRKRASELEIERRRKQLLFIKGVSALGCLAVIAILCIIAVGITDYSTGGSRNAGNEGKPVFGK